MKPGPEAAKAGEPASSPATAATPGAAIAANRKPDLARVAVVPWIAVVLLAVGLIMTARQMARTKDEPWRSKELNAAVAKLEAEPDNADLMKSIRDQDLRLRQEYFHALERNRGGTWLLVVGGVALVWFARQGFRPASIAPGAMPSGPVNRDVIAGRARITVGVVSVVCGGAFLTLGLNDHSHLPNGLADAGLAAGGVARVPGGSNRVQSGAAPVVAALPTAAEWSRNWPRFRGPEGSGSAPSKALPIAWDVGTGQGVVWKTNIALPGYNSPVVWGDRVFLTGGDKKARLVYCVDAANGAIRWQRPVSPPSPAAAGFEPPEQSGAAASTVATDGQRVFAVFASGELGALDFEGHLVWHRKLDFSENGYGHASSLVVWQNRLLVQADQGREEDHKSALSAFDVQTGEPVWTAKRPVGGSWATPLVINVAGKDQVVTAGEPYLMGHDAATGTELWKAKVLGGELAPSPVFANGVLIVSSPGRQFTALKAGGSGDVTASHVVWSLDKEVPDVPSPAVGGDLLYTASTEGMLICRELATGAKVWEHPFEMEIQASPMVAGDRLYVFAQPGDVFVVATGREFRQVAALKMGDEVFASPAVAGDRLIVRTRKFLYCLGVSAGPTQVADAR